MLSSPLKASVYLRNAPYFLAGHSWLYIKITGVSEPLAETASDAQFSQSQSQVLSQSLLGTMRLHPVIFLFQHRMGTKIPPWTPPAL